MLHFVCAFKSEAQVVIEHFSLKHLGDDGLFGVYVNRGNDISLTISGLGKLASSSAVMHTHLKLLCATGDMWVNIGIAGHQDHNIGKLVLCDRIEDEGSGQVWYPQILVDTDLPSSSLLTLDKPRDEYTEQMYDMEASGVFQNACRFSTLEFIHSLKVISDNKQQPLERMDKKVIYELVGDKIGDINNFVDSLEQLSKKLSDSGTEVTAEAQQFFSRSHFTANQQSQLITLLRRYKLLFPGNTAVEQFADDESAREILIKLREYMDAAPFSLGK